MGLFLLFFLLVPQTVSGEPLLALDPDAGDTLTPAEIAQVQEVISINQPLLGAAQREYCPKGRSPCLASLRAPATSEIIEPLRIESIWPETKAGSEWPTRVRPSNPRRLQVRIHWRKGNGRATRSIPLLIFGLSDGPRKENCVFPLEHWEWSGMGRSERFAIPPRGSPSRSLQIVLSSLENAEAVIQLSHTYKMLLVLGMNGLLRIGGGEGMPPAPGGVGARKGTPGLGFVAAGSGAGQ